MGMKIFEHGVEVVMARQRFSYANKFVRRSKRRLYLQREPANKHDSHAIKVIGKSKGLFFEANKCIGYVPADIARKLVLTGLEDKVKARLQLIYREGKGPLNIRFDLLGPLDDYQKYCSWKHTRAMEDQTARDTGTRADK